MPLSIRKWIYESYANDKSLARKLHRSVIGSPRIAKALFGMRIEPAGGRRDCFDLTTVLLLQVLKKRIRAGSAAKILEIGAGRSAILSGALSRAKQCHIEAVDIEPDLVASAARHVRLNGVDVNVYQSNIFESVPRQEFDLIFWNLPYYRDPNKILGGLFQGAPSYMSSNAELIIGYNSKPLPQDAILRILLPYRDLYVSETLTWRWNLHEVLVLKRAMHN